MLGNFDELIRAIESEENGYKVNCKDCRFLNRCLSEKLIHKQNAEPYLYQENGQHTWEEEGHYCIFKSKENYNTFNPDEEIAKLEAKFEKEFGKKINLRENL